MYLFITKGNYHIFLLMMKKHKNPHIRILTMECYGIDMLLYLKSEYEKERTMNILKEELDTSRFLLFCPCYTIEIPDENKLHGLRNKKQTYFYDFELSV